MKNPRIYQSAELVLHQHLTLDDNGSRHIGKVLRMLAGDSLRVFNSTGGEFQATITEVSKKQVQVSLDSFTEESNASPLRIHLAQVMSKGDRMDYAIQKAVELGVHSITPLTSIRCEVKLNPQRMEKRTLQWQQQIISASEQCGLNIVPAILPCASLASFCEHAKHEKKIILHPGPHKSQDYFCQAAPMDVCVLVGPEGGLEEQEIEIAKQHGFDCLTLGPRVFRTETAPVAMLTLLQHYWGDL
ncbi:16S rRNA (uracil(1498)-N(3))-methyltransferase [Gammaproteobacteria bacterium 45_16_T64]|nr:16S rRNA (uracil(1498)-N(3))-methyltransferase [Gammaproteobacteria bacterium 45_16_T64]